MNIERLSDAAWEIAQDITPVICNWPSEMTKRVEQTTYSHYHLTGW
jgi:hypothetical protein